MVFCVICRDKFERQFSLLNLKKIVPKLLIEFNKKSFLESEMVVSTSFKKHFKFFYIIIIVACGFQIVFKNIMAFRDGCRKKSEKPFTIVLLPNPKNLF